jgi:hypothetical protein
MLKKSIEEQRTGFINVATSLGVDFADDVSAAAHDEVPACGIKFCIGPDGITHYEVCGENPFWASFMNQMVDAPRQHAELSTQDDNCQTYQATFRRARVAKLPEDTKQCKDNKDASGKPKNIKDEFELRSNIGSHRKCQTSGDGKQKVRFACS